MYYVVVDGNRSCSHRHRTLDAALSCLQRSNRSGPFARIERIEGGKRFLLNREEATTLIGLRTAKKPKVK